MAKYLDTSQISSELMQLLKEAKEKIILVTYSLQVNKQIQERLKTKSKLGILSEITLIFGNTTLTSSELKWMSEIDDLRLYQKKNLHAKCYINESKAIISSMNLYEYSQVNNVEMGFLITRKDDGEAYEKMMDDIEDLIINGTRKRLSDLKDDAKYFVDDKTSNADLKKRKSVSKLSYYEQVKKRMLESFRRKMSRELRQKADHILSNQAIFLI